MATVSVSTKPWRVGYATSATSSCETCKSTIDKEELRLGKMVRSSQIDRVIPIWNHADCIMSKANQIKSVDDVKDLELLHWEDQQKIRKYVEGSEASTKNFSTPSECSVEVSPTSCAACRTCGYLIGKGQMRVSTKPNGQGVRCPAWYHARCFIKMSTSIQLNKISGWNYLPDFHQAKLRSWVNNVPSTDNENKHEIPDKEVVQESISKAGLKRKKDAIGIPKSKVVKAEGIVSASPVNSSRNDGKSGSEDVQVAELESKLEAQMKVKGQRGVHESSGMQDSGHILEDAKSIYNTTLHMSDLSKGVNSYYILQIIQEDRGSGYYLFRKWGGAGNKKVRGCTLEKLTKSDAIRAFKQVFSEKTGNSWEAWESKENFQKQPGRFYPLDDYGVNKPVTKKIVNDAACQLAAPVKEEDEIIVPGAAVSRFTLKEDAPTGIPVKEHEIAGAAVSRLTLKEDAPTTVPVKEDKLTASGAVVSRLTLKKDTPTAMPVKEDEIAVPGVAVSRLTVKGDAPTIVPVKEDEIAVPVAAVSSFTLNEDIPTTSNLVTPHSSGVHSAEARVVTVSMEQAPVSTSAPSSSTHHVLTQVSHKMELFTLLEKGAHALIKGKDFSSVIRLLDLEIKENAQPSMIILLSELRETSEKIRGVDLEKTTAAMTSAAADLTEEKKLFEDCILPTKAIEYWRVHNKAKLANLEEQIRNLEEQIRTIQTARQNFLRFEEWLDQYARNIKEDDEQSETRMSKLLAELEELKKEQDIKSGFESILVRHFDTLVASLFKAQCSSTTKDASVELYTE